MTSEVWREVPSHAGYEVSDQGRVRSWRRGSNGKVLTPEIQADGYARVNLHGTDERGSHVQRPARVHALVLLAFVGPKPDGSVRRHLDGNPKNNTLCNLAYGSSSQNNLDAVQHGTHFWAAKTVCPAGHPYDADNTAITSGSRRCLTCRRLYNARTKLRRSRSAGVA